MPPSEFRLTRSFFVGESPQAWRLVFSKPLDTTGSTLDLADWAVLAQPGWTAPTRISGTVPSGGLLLENEDYSALDTRIRFTGPFQKVFATDGASLQPFDLPTG